MKSLHELFSILYYFSTSPVIDEQNISCICDAALYLANNGIITRIEHNRILDYMYTHVPKTDLLMEYFYLSDNPFAMENVSRLDFWWEKYNWTPRRAWLKRTINKLK